MSQIRSTKSHVLSYLIGFLLSIVLTIAAYLLVVNEGLRDKIAPAAVVIILSLLASAQLIVQLLFFLHLGDESKPRWRLMSFIFAFTILGIIVFGSLWIMFDMNSRMMMSPTDMIKYMNRQSGV